MSSDVQKIGEQLKDILSPEKGYFGRVSTWRQTTSEYEQIGFVLTEDFTSMLSLMTDEKRKNLISVMTYFEIHSRPLKNLLNANEAEGLYKFYSEIAWSHFATVVMFGMLEVAVKGERGKWLNNKGNKIKIFLEDNLSQEIKDDVVERYSIEEIFNHETPKTFSKVVDHLWKDVRGGFIHDVGIESKGLEYASLIGVGTKENPITIKRDVPMPEWLQLTWQAILNSYGYKGRLEHPKFNRKRNRNSRD